MFFHREYNRNPQKCVEKGDTGGNHNLWYLLPVGADMICPEVRPKDAAFKPPFSFETSKENRRLIGEKKNVGGLSERKAPQSLKRELFPHRLGRKSAVWNAAPRCLYQMESFRHR